MMQIKIENNIRKLFYHVGFLIGKHPYKILFFCLLAFLACSAGLLRFHEVNDIRDDYTALDSPSRFEYAVLQEFFQEKGKPFYLYVAIEAKNGSNLLTNHYMDEILRIEKWLHAELNVTYKGDTVTYSNLCTSHCDINHPLTLFLTARRSQRISEFNRNIVLQHPTTRFFGEEFYIGNHLLLVEKNRTTVISARLIILHFHATYSNETTSQLLRLWETKVFEEFYLRNTETPFDVAVNSEGLISSELRKTGMSVMPLMPLSVLVMLLFTVLTSLKLHPAVSKPWEAAAGVLCPLLGLASSIGILLWFGVHYQPIVSVMPFLVLAVGVDDAFLTLHAWHRTEKDKKVEERLAETLADVGPSITITSLTNSLAFGIGAFSSTPAVQCFCTFTSVAMAVEYGFQILYFSAVVAVGGRHEAEGRNAYCPCLKANENRKQDAGPAEIQKKLSALSAKLIKLWSKAAISWPARFVVLTFLLAFWSISAYGMSQTKVQLSVDKLFLPSSPLHKWIRVQQIALFKEANALYVFVNGPGNLTNVTRLSELLTMKTEFDSMPHSLSSASWWLRDYLKYKKFFGNGEQLEYRQVPMFLDVKVYDVWNYQLKVNLTACTEQESSCIQKFFFTLGFGNSTEWNRRLEILKGYRNLATKYAQFNVTIYEENAMFADQIPTIVQSTKFNLLIAIFSMSVVCLIFIPNFQAVFCVTLSLMNISFGVFGFLMVWNVDLDPISMATILMSIGFSVDFTAHVCYHYFKGDKKDPQSRLETSLSSTAWPSIQSGSSTILAVCVLTAVPAYMILVFVKTVFLVIMFGLVHGLVILPVLLTSISSIAKSATCSFEQK